MRWRGLDTRRSLAGPSATSDHRPTARTAGTQRGSMTGRQRRRRQRPHHGSHPHRIETVPLSGLPALLDGDRLIRRLGGLGLAALCHWPSQYDLDEREAHIMRSVTVQILVLSGVSLLTLASIADAAGPGQADFDICNREAHMRAASPSAAPAAGADTAKKPGTPVSPSAAPATETPPTPSPSAASGADPGIKPGTPVSPSAETQTPAPGAATGSDDLSRGMAASGQADPAFRYAYIECMKKRGF
jgi:hypothetical protein